MFRKKRKKTTLNVEGMTCDFCAKHIEDKLKGVDGIEKVKASFPENKVDLFFKEDTAIDLDNVREEIHEIGYAVVD